MSFKPSLALVGAFAAKALAHGTVSGFVTDGTYNQGFLLDYYYEKINSGSFPDIAAWYAEDTDNGFVSPSAYGTSDINCHINSEPGALTSSVAAGGTVDFQWTTWPHGIGPVLTYVAACGGDCSAADKTTLEWVKIDESGYDSSTSTWAAQTLIDNNSTWTTTVPSTLAAGNYVFRHEIIALHGAGSADGAQNYPQCFNIAITGSGTDSPSGTLGTALYKEDDAGILFNPYAATIEYTIPGPALYTGGSGSGSATTTKAAASSTQAASSAPAATTSAAAVTSAPAVTSAVASSTSVAAEEVSSTTAAAPATTSAADAGDDDEDSCDSDDDEPTVTSAVPTTAAASSAAAPTTLVTRTSSKAASATSGSSSGSVALYGQCGGASYTGATSCASGTCTVMNDYYSQCV
ncbi:glycosyl hydrolase family 61-domain-containing protein [Truncatella angustata]|uniref:lytic cellulose monooxygenase (C4-dehydrogenating) n=1 Tax=Truncatella angustata TaxID=152316 RepID=A0A9P8RK44_9PEZI|nr:glycosyl hydrolase family 61-domain-containing protein [Truncatella angustata]KAH6647294.1 glycosyl hydrolase family 61-domain-containing protein [Truncatella angustata]